MHSLTLSQTHQSEFIKTPVTDPKFEVLDKVVCVKTGSVHYTCTQCKYLLLAKCDWTTLGPAAAAHVETHWLREYLGKVHDAAAEDSEILWSSIPEWDVFKSKGIRLPQCSEDMPRFIVALLESAVRKHFGSYELQFVLDAVLRNNILWSEGTDTDGDGVCTSDILQAVYDSEILSNERFGRFQALIEHPLPLLVVDFNEHDKTRVAFIRRRWDCFPTEYLDAEPAKYIWKPKKQVEKEEKASKKRKASSPVDVQVAN